MTAVLRNVAPQLVSRKPLLSVSLAETEQEIVECQALRYQVFADEMNAYIDTETPGLDRDRFDRYCQHLVVRNELTGQVIGTTRLLTSDDASKAGLYYSETQFDLSAVRANLSGRFMEIGRTCIHSEYRNGATLAMLWQGIGRVTMEQDLDYLIGCASIPMDFGPEHVEAVMRMLRDKHMSPGDMRVQPYVSMPHHDGTRDVDVVLPPLLKGYLKQGAWICGEAYYDAAFHVADVFVLLKREQLAARYIRHFLKGTQTGCQSQQVSFAS